MRLRLVAAALLGLVAWAAACDFGVDLGGLTDGAPSDGQGEAMSDAADTGAPDVGLDAPTPSIPIIAIDVGAAHACGARKDGSVVCWGANGNGQLGNGTTLDSSVPVQVLGITDAIAISLGGSHSCALRQTGNVVCWGFNSSGQLGDGTTS